MTDFIAPQMPFHIVLVSDFNVFHAATILSLIAVNFAVALFRISSHFVPSVLLIDPHALSVLVFVSFQRVDTVSLIA